MPQSQARVVTETPARYLGQLCKHFQHRLPVTLEAQTGQITFEAGVCDLTADDAVLLLRCESTDAAGLERVQEVVARHLLRFAFRTPPEIVWTALD